MKVSYNWLQDHIDGKLPEPEKLGDILTMGAYELEGVEKVGDDFVLDFDVQPNRAHDSFGHWGVAKEITILVDDLKIKEYSGKKIEEDFNTDVKVEIENKKCKRYVAREIRGVEVRKSPDWIKERLEAIGQKSINNIVDITNIVMFDISQPMHAFDKDKLDGDTIFIREAKQGEKLTTLDNKEIVFKGGEIIIADEKDPIAIAGIKGGNKAEVDESTKNIILESANFDFTKIRFTRRDLGIETDSSKRFERDITPDWCDKATRNATDLIIEYANTDDIKVSNIVDVYPRPVGIYKTGISVEEANKRLGINLSGKELENIFNKLDFEFRKVNSKENFVKLAKSVEGKPYKFGSSVLYDAPDSFDCSALISYCAKESGLSVPRMSIDQYVWSEEISKEDLEPGDLIFSNQHITKDSNQETFKDRPDIQCKVRCEHDTSKEFLPGTKIEKPIDHNGIYLGEEKVVHCTSIDDKGTVIEDLNSSPHFKDIISYRRIFEKDEERYVITIPHERVDIRTKEDLTEEIARVYGINNIESKEVTRVADRVVDPIYFYQSKISKFLIENGFSEIITYTLQDEGNVEIANPLASDKNFMRETLISGLRDSLKLNIHNAYLLGLGTIKVFEFGKVFEGEGERWMLSIGLEIKDAKKSKSKALLEEIIGGLEEYLDVKIKGKIVEDTMIEINFEKLVKDLPEPSSNDYYELDLDGGEVAYKPFSQYPFMLRDIAVWVPITISDDELLDLIRKEAGDLLVQTSLFDRYEKKDEEKVSYAYKLVFQSYEKTLTDEEINKVMDKVTEKLNKEEGFEVR